jgi:hypothetical protein
MGIIGRFLERLIFGGEHNSECFRDFCPACFRKGLERFRDKSTLASSSEVFEIVDSVPLWRQCIFCGARFQKKSSDGVLEPVTDQEWEEDVGAPRAGSQKPQDPPDKKGKAT